MRFKGLPVDSRKLAIEQGLQRLQEKGIIRANASLIAKSAGMQDFRGDASVLLVGIHPHSGRDVLNFPGMRVDDTISQEFIVRGYPVDLVDKVESVFRENTGLRQRVQFHEARDN